MTIGILFDPSTEQSTLYEETAEYKRAFGPVMAVDDTQARQFLQHLGRLHIEPLDVDPTDLCQLYSEWYHAMGLPDALAPTPVDHAIKR